MKKIFVKTFGCQGNAQPDSKRRSNFSLVPSSKLSSPESGMTSKCPHVYIKTFGCQANVRDSEFVEGILLERGFAKAKDIEAADVILFNSCSVRKHAEDKLFSNIAELKFLKKKNPRLIIGLMGCTAQNYKSEALKRAPLVDFACGPGNEAEIPDILAGIIDDRCRVVAVDKVHAPRPELFPKYREGDFKAYVSISEGCDNFCSYCIVPYVRGRERSRKMGDIVREVKDLAERGFKEITLLGQNVNSYGRSAYSVERIAHMNDKKLSAKRYPLNAKHGDFIHLLEALNRINGIKRIRFMTSHPKDATEDLFKAMRDLDKVCEHLHLPLQSGSDRILKLMNRGYTSGKYMRLVDSYKKVVPGGSITSDVVVGFPTETDRDFKRSLKLMEEAGFDSTFLFKYSPRPPAKSAKLVDDVSEKVKKERLDILLKAQCRISESRNAVLVGKVVEMLVEGNSDRSPGALIGRSRENKNIICKASDEMIGKIINVKVNSVTPYALKGEIV
ncbi:MAG: tRNA (N6-isopentenyl adenosine(37)-C2)-methylthiotransferase MiaB [Candidatus Omnitrophica bacterium]|nr:tRNA (N6-isopentenyl adenosine(37)-C2)-methylthiotransferase MiaB [Candidatus Omnitrophota bacterium]